MTRSLELAELRALCAAAELGSLGRAALRLRVSQQALSKRLRALEAVLGARLLERSAHGVSLTPAGRRVYEGALQVLDQADSFERELLGLGDVGEPVRVAASPTIADFVLPWELAAIERDTGCHPTLELSVVNSCTAVRMVAAGGVELAIAGVDARTLPEGICHEPFRRDEVVLAVPAGHHWAAVEEVPLKAFLSTALIVRDPAANARRVVDSALRERGTVLARPLLEVGSTGEAREAARRRRVPALLSELAVAGAEGLVARRVAGIRFERCFSLLTAGGSSLSAPARVLAGRLRRRAER